MNLFEKITHLRSQASFLYDLGRQNRLSPDKIGETIRPLASRLEVDINTASLKDKARAIKSLEGQIEALAIDQKYIEEKINESAGYIERIKLSLSEELGDEGHAEEDGYIVTKVNGQINVR